MKKYYFLAVIGLLVVFQHLQAQTKGYEPKIEPCDCLFKADSSLKTQCAYLIVPENRAKPAGKTIKLPFIYVSSSDPHKKKDPVLYTVGGPGGSSLRGVSGVKERSLNGRDFIAFEQRGTQYAQPCLACEEVTEAAKTAYRDHLSKDSLELLAIKACRERLAGQGIDLSAYNSIESAADIEDLRLALKIDSLNLLGMSYSGGLLLTVLRNFPSGIRSAVLDSPLPGFVSYDENGLQNIHNALHQVFSDCRSDSTDQVKYGNLEERFQQYFTAIGGKTFTMNYTEKSSGKTYPVRYSRNELLDVILDKLSVHADVANVPFVVTEIIRGNHTPYIRGLMDGVFNNTGGSSLGMRYSVYCSEQIAFADEQVIRRQQVLFPYLAGYGFNNVNHGICDCWKVRPIDREAKKPFYSSIPVLLGAGAVDPWCSPMYNDLVHYYLPNSQRLLFSGKTHMPLLTREGGAYIQQFWDHPYQRIMPAGKGIIAY